MYSQSTDRTFVRGRSRLPGTRDGMRWVLSLSAAVEEGTGIGTGSNHGILRDVRTLYLCGRQGQTYETLEKGTREWLGPGYRELIADRALGGNRTQE